MKRNERAALLAIGFGMVVLGCGGFDGSDSDETEFRYKAGIYTAQADGYHAAHTSGIPVEVQVEFSAAAITGIEITRHSETASRPAVNSALTQIPQAILSRQQAEVDGISGATFTSGAIINAVKDCISQAARSGGGYEPGLYTASAPGYHSAQNAGDPVKVRVDFSTSAITAVKIVSHNETISIEAVKTALTQIPQAILNSQQAEVDGISGATFTSGAIINAVKECVSKAELP